MISALRRVRHTGGTRIPTFREWIAFCREADVTPYIELKSRMTTEQV